MSAEPIADAVTPAESAEKGLLIVMLMLVLAGVGALLTPATAALGSAAGPHPCPPPLSGRGSTVG